MSATPTPLSSSAELKRAGLPAALCDIPRRLRRQVSSGGYRPEIDGLRFIAIAIVVIGHFTERAVRFFPSFRAEIGDRGLAELFQRPGIGVYLFFTISGFIIATQALKAKASPLSGRFLSAYFGRRVLRIEPPYVILLVGTYALVTVSGYAPEGTRQFWTEPQSLATSLLGSIFYVHDLVWGTFPRLFPPGWSLEAEVQFYLVAPMLFWVWFRLKGSSARAVVGIVVLALGAALALRVPRQIGPAFVYFGLLRFFPYFWLGILLATSNAWLMERIKTISPLAMSVVGWAGLVGYFILPSAPEALGVGLLVQAGSYLTIAAMFVGAFAAGSSFRRFCSLPWVSLIGGACYSVYLIHLQVLQVLMALAAKVAPGGGIATICVLAVVGLSGVVAAGLGFYAVVERPFMTPNWPGSVRTWLSRKRSSGALSDREPSRP